MTTYALDLPVQPSGGRKHVEDALQGSLQNPANYSFAAKDGTELIYHVCGSGPVLLLSVAPGWGPGINYLPTGFHPIVDSNKITFVCLQPRGSFPSGNPSDETQMSSKHMAADVDALREELGQDTVSVLGHSNGAAISLAYAEAFPNCCSKAVLITTQCIGWDGFMPYIKEQLQARMSDPRFTHAATEFASVDRAEFTQDSEPTDFINSVLPLYFNKPESHAKFMETMGNPPPPIRYWGYTKQRIADDKPEASLVGDLSKVTADVLVITGRHDFLIGAENSQFVVDGMTAAKSTKHIIYEDSGHMPWIEEKEAFFKDVIEFLI